MLPLYLHFWPTGAKQFRVEIRTLQALEHLAAKPEPWHQLPKERVCYGNAFADMPESVALIASILGDLVMPILTPASQVESIAAALRKAVTAANTIADVAPIIRRDFDQIARLAEWQRWTDDTPVPPEIFGPLWPEKRTAGWPADSDIPQRSDLPLELLSRGRNLEQMTEDETVHLFNLINEYYIARTGNRLTMEGLRPFLTAAVLVEV